MSKHEKSMEPNMYIWKLFTKLPKCKASPECISTAGSGLTGEHPTESRAVIERAPGNAGKTPMANPLEPATRTLHSAQTKQKE